MMTLMQSPVFNFFIAKLFLKSLNKNNQTLLTEISCFQFKNDEGEFLLWWKVNRLKTIMCATAVNSFTSGCESRPTAEAAYIKQLLNMDIYY